MRPLDWTRGAGRSPVARSESVDVIVPVYVAAADLERCLASVAAETDFTRHGLILVIDGPQGEAVEYPRQRGAQRPGLRRRGRMPELGGDP